jgi:hypothetical protein
VGVKNPVGLRQQQLPKLHDAVGVCRVVCWQSKHAQAFLVRTRFESAIFQTNDHLPVTALLKAASEQQELPLPTSQFFPGVDVDDSQVGRRW